MDEGNQTFLYICVFTACLLGLISGIPLSWSSPIIPILEGSTNANPLPEAIDATQSSWIISLMLLGLAIGPLLTATTTKLIGLKYTLIGIGVTFAISFLILAFAKNVNLYFIARLLSGMALGSVYSVLPSYIAHVSPVDIRGAMGSIFNIVIILGILIPYCIGPYTSILGLNIICAAISLVFIIAFLFMPESPVYLISKNKPSKAKDILKKLRGCNDVDKEFNLIIQAVEKNKQKNISNLFKIKSNLKALFISSSLVALQQLSGIIIIIVNAQTIFEKTGSSIPSNISSMIIGTVQLLPSFIIPFFIETLGRKILLLISAFFMLISCLPLGFYFYLKNNGSDVSSLYWLPILCLVVFMIAYTIGFGPIVWIVLAEIFPPNVAHIGSALVAFLCGSFSFIFTHFSVNIVNFVGMAGLFWVFSAFNMLAIIFVLFYVPETKGKTMLEIQKMLS